MGIILTNALLVDIDPPGVELGSLQINEGCIVARGASVTERAGDEVIDCRGAVVMPGLVNGHTHLYSALATGMPAPPSQPQNFHENLQFVWWRLDQAHDAVSIEMSARIGALDALRCGTTTLIDHHASPSLIHDSLGLVERGIEQVGLRGLLCYETTDRHGLEGRQAGLEENRRYLEKRHYQRSNRFAGMVGGHALFTLEDETLQELVLLANQFNTGVHLHVAEDVCDEEICQEEHQTLLIDRLNGYGLLLQDSIFAHGTHLDEEAIMRVSSAGLSIAHSPRSNMNNAVGYTPIFAYSCPVILGTDGIGSDMFTEAKHAWFKSRDGLTGLAPQNIVEMLAASARRASESLDITLGKLTVEAAGDVIITDYIPATPLTAENFAGHFIFSMGAHNVKDVIAGGQWALRDRKVVSCPENVIRSEASGIAESLWQRMSQIPMP